MYALPEKSVESRKVGIRFFTRDDSDSCTEQSVMGGYMLWLQWCQLCDVQLVIATGHGNQIHSSMIIDNTTSSHDWQHSSKQ